MAQDSWNYSCTVGGDARAIAQEDWQRSRAIMRHSDRTLDGVVYTKESNWGSGAQDFSALLIPSNPGGNTVRIANGAALVNGFEYYNDDDVDFDVSGGQANATDLIVLRSTPATGLVRLAHVQALAPATAATVTQDLTTWEIAIAEVLLDAGGNFSALTDVRKPCLAKGAVIPLDDYTGDGVTTVATFNNIPSIFEQLRIEGLVKIDDALVTNAGLYMRFNNNGGANYSWINISSVGGTTSNNADNYMLIGNAAANNAATDVSRFVLEIPFYKNSTYYTGFESTLTNIIGAVTEHEDGAGWFLVAGAITRVDISADAFVGLVNFSTNSQIKLYGIV